MYDGEENSKNYFVEMLYVYLGSFESVKIYVFYQFSDNNICFCIFVVIIVYGMGVNCKGVLWVIYFGLFKLIEVYL